MKNLFSYSIFATVFLFLSFSSFSQTCSLNCIGHVNASMPSNVCDRTFDPKDFLTNPDPSCTSYNVILSYPFGTAQLSGNNVNSSHIGYTFVYQITTGKNSCWGSVTIEDKAPPQPYCSSATISCFQFADINDLAKKVVDNCSEAGQSIIEKITWTDFGCTLPKITGKAIRDIRTIDQWGNSTTCSDTLFIRRDSFPLIKCADLITLSCIMKCKKTDNKGSVSDPTNFDTFVFSPDPKNTNYPSPDKLIDLQKRDTFNSAIRKCIASDLLVVPYIRDSVFKIVNGKKVLSDSLVSMYRSTGLLCKMLVSYSDISFPMCGNTFKIRREWRFTNWCDGKDTFCVQYIVIEDKVAPIITSKFTIPFRNGDDYGNIIIPGYRINTTSNVHDCFGSFCLESLQYEDCSKVNQQFILSYDDPTRPGGRVVKNNKVGDCLSLPSAPNNYVFSDLFKNTPEYLKDFTMPRSCYPIFILAQDECLNTTSSSLTIVNQFTQMTSYIPSDGIAGIALICITDETPPNPVCDQVTQTTIDPDKCWSRIYAADLDNGSKDNCCDVLHFAIAPMDTIEYYRKAYAKQLEDSCGKADYWKDKSTYDQIIENWINCYIFKDYVDVTECKPVQMVLRVYEACGIPRYDDHLFKCSNHDWFCYNTYPSYMLWHNYSLKNNPKNICNSPFPWLCLKKNNDLIKNLLSHSNKYWVPAYAGATQLLLNNQYPITAAYCFPEFFYGDLADQSESQAPGNTCSKRLYNDCMVSIHIDDKTPPVAQEPRDKFWYCDNVSSTEGDQYEYAKCNDDSWKDDNATDKTCTDEYGLPYNEIESRKENDKDLSDITDPTGKYYGWYGCNIYYIGHPDEHGTKAVCPPDQNLWAPIYCHSWLLLDSTDAPGKVNVFDVFDAPILRSGNPGTTDPGKKRFFIWDNCWIDPTSLDSTDDSYIDNCGNGWIKRTWNARDKCGNKVSVDQKIVTKHRSDFEVEFPSDKIIICDNDESTSPDALGRPIVMDDECELVGINYEDQRFDIVPDACFKIVRTWRLVDWCKYDPNQQNRSKDIIVDDRKVADTFNRPCVYRHLKDNGDGFMTYVQIIKIKDTIPPVVTTKNDTVCIFDTNCALPSVNIPFTATDNCTAPNLITYRWEMDENPSPSDLSARRYNPASIDKRSGTSVTSLSIVQKISVSLVTVIAEDNCGNEDTSTFILTVRDCKKPTPYCYNGVATVIMPSTGNVKIWATDFNAGSYDNCTPSSKLKYSFGPNITDSCKVLTCKDIPNGVSFTITVDIYVWDEAGNFDFCRTYITIQDGSGDVCDNAKSVNGSISGNVLTSSDQPIENVLIHNISIRTLPAYMTTAVGQYAFTNLDVNTNYSIKPNRTDQPINGVSTIDLLKIQKHILGQEPLQDPYLLIAADVNNDKEITALDLIELRKLILNINSEFSNNTSWRFVPKSFKPDALHPFDFPEKLDITNLNADELNKDFIGIKIGDLNNTATAHSLKGLESRSIESNLILETSDASVSAGEIVSMKLKTVDANRIQSLQFTLTHPDLELINIEGKALQIDQRNFGIFNEAITLSWNQSNLTYMDRSKELFTITFKAKKALKLSEKIFINSNRTIAETFDGKTIQGVQLGFDHQAPFNGNNYSLNQNTPNPFQSNTWITFDLPRDENVSINITDLMGRIVLSKKINGSKGSNRWNLNQNALPGTGIYYYTLEAKNYAASRKLILIK